MPGIIVQTAVFGAAGTGIGLAEDMAKGLIERFRSLPASPALPCWPGAPWPTRCATCS